MSSLTDASRARRLEENADLMGSVSSSDYSPQSSRASS
jgi:hypothetical protein